MGDTIAAELGSGSAGPLDVYEEVDLAARTVQQSSSASSQASASASGEDELVSLGMRR
jgi:hypothetical protein